MDLLLIVVVSTAVGLLMAGLGLARREPGSILLGVGMLAIAAVFLAFYLLSQIGG